MQEIEKIPKYKKVGILILFSLILLFVIIFIFEIFLKLFASPIYGFQKNVFVYDNYTGYRLTPNYSGMQSIYGKKYFVEINENGLRDSRNYPYNKPEGTKRIVIIGDSISFGNGVDLPESYTEYLRGNFEGKNVEVINLGIPGYGINNEYIYFLEEGQKYDPDILIIQYDTNDWGIHQISEKDGELVVDTNKSFIADKNGFLIAYESQSFIRPIHLFLLRKLRSYSFIYTKLRNSLSGIINFLGGSSEAVPRYVMHENSPEYQENYEGYYKILSSLKDKTDAKVVLFIGPSVTDFLDTIKIKEEFNLNYTPNARQTQTSLKKAAEELGIYFIAIEYPNQDIFLEIDNHWNAKGNKLVADALYGHLNNLLLQ